MGSLISSSITRWPRTPACRFGGRASAARLTSCSVDGSPSASGRHVENRTTAWKRGPRASASAKHPAVESTVEFVAQVRRTKPEHSKLQKKGTIMNLKLIAPIVTLASALVLAPISYAEAAPNGQRGMLLDVQEDTEYVPTVQFGRVHRNGNKDWTTVELPSTRKQTTYTVKVALDGIIYTARSSGDFWGYNPSKMIVGTELEARVEANKLVIARPDGKQYKPTITRRERDQAASH